MTSGGGDGRLLQFLGGSGPTLLLIHGLLGSTRWWSRNIDDFQAHFSVYSVDLPGFGTNRKARRFQMEEVVAMLQREVETLPEGRVAVIGHSLGGVVAAGLASSAPERIGPVVLVDAAFLSLEPGWVRRIGGIAREGLRLPPGFLPLLLRDMTRARIPAVSDASYELLFRDWATWLERLEQPCQIIWGEYDQIVPLSVGRALHRRIDGSELEIIPGAGHTPMWSNPEAFDALALGFLLQCRNGVTEPGTKP